MQVFVVMQADKDNFSNDWDTVEYYVDFKCIGVFTTLKLAATSIEIHVDKLIDTLINDDGVSLGEGWRYIDKSCNKCYFIVKRNLTVE